MLIEAQPESEDSPLPKRERLPSGGLSPLIKNESAGAGLDALDRRPSREFEDFTRDKNNLLLMRARRPVYR